MLVSWLQGIMLFTGSHLLLVGNLQYRSLNNYITGAVFSGRSRGGRGGRTPPLSEFETFIHGAFCPCPRPPPIAPPQDLFLLG